MGNNVNVANGLSGGQLISGTSLVPIRACAIHVIADAKFHTLTGNLTGVADTDSGTARTFVEDKWLFGSFTHIQLHSGVVIAYQSV